MLSHYGEQRWWPADTPFEMMIGAVLTQATSWTNVEIAIARLKDADALSPAAIRCMDIETLAALIYSSGFYNAKAQRLKALVAYIGETYDDDIDAMRLMDGAKLRCELLGVKGIGEETTDAILLYALEKPSFVIDAYTRRLVSRLGIAPDSEGVLGIPESIQRQSSAGHSDVRRISRAHCAALQGGMSQDAGVRGVLPEKRLPNGSRINRSG